MTDAIYRAAEATREFTETEAAFTKVREQLIYALVSSPTMASMEREKLYFAIQGLDGVKAALMAVIYNGDVETAAQEIREKFKAA